MKFWTKKLETPVITHKQVDAVQLWQVEWTSRYDRYSSHTKQEFEVFTSEETATEYANALKAAFKLIRHTSGNEVVLTKRL